MERTFAHSIFENSESDTCKLHHFPFHIPFCLLLVCKYTSIKLHIVLRLTNSYNGFFSYRFRYSLGERNPYSLGCKKGYDLRVYFCLVCISSVSVDHSHNFDKPRQYTRRKRMGYGDGHYLRRKSITDKHEPT